MSYKWINVTLFISLILIICPETVWVSVARGQSSDKNFSSTISVEQFTKLVVSIEDWHESKNYSKQGWVRLMTLARSLQTISPDLIEKRLSELQLIGSTNGDFNDVSYSQLPNDRKLYLLMRIIFDLPENASKEDSFGTGGWITMQGDKNDHGTFDLAWPIKWENGHPKLISGYLGIESTARYNAAVEYHYLRSKYKMRNLFSIAP